MNRECRSAAAVSVAGARAVTKVGVRCDARMGCHVIGDGLVDLLDRDRGVRLQRVCDCRLNLADRHVVRVDRLVSKRVLDLLRDLLSREAGRSCRTSCASGARSSLRTCGSSKAGCTVRAVDALGTLGSVGTCGALRTGNEQGDDDRDDRADHGEPSDNAVHPVSSCGCRSGCWSRVIRIHLYVTHSAAGKGRICEPDMISNIDVLELCLPVARTRDDPAPPAFGPNDLVWSDWDCSGKGHDELLELVCCFLDVDAGDGIRAIAISLRLPTSLSSMLVGLVVVPIVPGGDPKLLRAFEPLATARSSNFPRTGSRLPG